MKTPDNLLSDLNDEQRRAVTHTEGPLLIVAGAGTGKTTVITRRIAWLIATEKCATDEILALTFTEKAAAEMEERVDRLLPYGYVDLWISTFHGFCEKILRRHGLDIGLPTNFKLLDQTASWMLIRKNLELFELDYYRPAGNPTKCIHELIKHFSRCKDEAISPDTYVKYAESLVLEDASEITRTREVAHAYATYQQLLLDASALDFGDLIVYTLRLFRERPAILKRYQTMFKYILVDEFQDTNYAQYEIIKLLSAGHSNITVVGDDDQSVYRWRGTSLANITQFKTDYPQSSEIFLTRNYRSRQNILDLAYTFIQQNNPNRLEYQLQQAGSTLSKQLQSVHDAPGTIEHKHCATLDEEVDFVIRKIQELKNDHDDISWSDMAILVRSNDSATHFIAKCHEYGIPYQFLGLKGLYVKPIIVDILSYCTVLLNYHDSAAYYRVLNFPFLEIQPQSIIQLSHFAHRKGLSLWQAAEHIDQEPDILAAEKDKIKAVSSRILAHASLARSGTAVESLYAGIQDSGYLAYLSKCDTGTSREALDYLNQLFEKAKRFQSESPNGHLREFLDFIRLEQEAGDAGTLSKDIETGPDTVKIMTIHGSKGLEFRYVFIVTMIDRRFPVTEREDALELPSELRQERSQSSGDAHLEEERRLFYVALTRGKEGIYLTSAQDYGGARTRKPSRFLSECGFVRESDVTAKNTLITHTRQPQPSSELPSGFQWKLPSVISFTQLKAFQTCPLQYKFAFLLKLPTFGRYQFSFGKSIHATLESFFNLFMETGKEYTNHKELPSEDELLKLYERYWIDEWYPSQKEKDEFFAKGKEILKRMYAEILDERPRTRSIEQDFTLKFGNGEQMITLKGRIDRIDDVDGGVEIIDYKTGKSKSAESIRYDDKEQLIIYQLAAEDILQLKPVKLTYYYVEDGNKVSFLGTQKEKDKLLNAITETVEKMRQSSFDATPGFLCKYCDFKSICEFREL